MLIGFNQTKSNLANLYLNKKLHHAILLQGKKGIGKASFAKEFVGEILKNNSDILIIEKEEGKKDITVEKIRKISSFVNQTSSGNSDKFIIINSACELNKSAANALLKILEEPHAHNFLILIAHNLHQVLPTIRSRCQTIKISDFSFADFEKIIKKNSAKFSAEEILFLAEIFDNSPAQALELGEDISRFYQLFLRSILNNKLHDELTKKIADKNFSFLIFENIFNFLISRLTRAQLGDKPNFFFEEGAVFTKILQQFSLNEIFTINDESLNILRKTTNLYLDRKLCLINVFNRLTQNPCK